MRRALAITALVTGALLSPTGVARGGDGPVSWSTLSYSASKFLLHARTEVAIVRIQADEAAALLLTPTAGRGLAPLNGDVVLVTLDARGLGTIAETEVVVDPEDGACLQRIQVDTGRRPRYKAYRYMHGGVTVVRRHPGPKEKDARPDTWSELSESFKTYPGGTPEGLRPSEPSALFALLADAALGKPGDRARYPMYAKGVLLDVELSAVSISPTDVDYRIASPAGERRVDGRRDLLRVLLTARRMVPGDSEVELTFLGLEGDLELRLDPEIGVPVEIRGRVPVVGSLVVRLDRIEMASPAPAPTSEPVPPRTQPPAPSPHRSP